MLSEIDCRAGEIIGCSSRLRFTRFTSKTSQHMKILKQREAFLSDYEVLKHLNSIKEENAWSFSSEDDAQGKSRRKRGNGAGVGLEMITRDLLSYLTKNAAGSISSDERFADLMTFLNGFDLMKAEKLQIMNSLPRSIVHLYGLVEECDQRLDEETCQCLIDKIDTLFPVATAADGEDVEVEET